MRITKVALWATAVLVPLGGLGIALAWPPALLAAMGVLWYAVWWIRDVCRDYEKAVHGRDRF